MKPRRKKSAAWALGVGLLGSTVALTSPMALAGSDVPPVVGGNVMISSVNEFLYVDSHQTAAIGSGTTTYLHAKLELEPGTTFDLSGDTWIPMGTAADPFTGTFDGNGDVISGVSITAASIPPGSSGAVGLFGVVSGATLSGVALKQETISVHATPNESVDAGGLVGAAVAHGQLGQGAVTLTDVTGSDITVAVATGDFLEMGGLLGAAASGSLTNLDVVGVSVTATASNIAKIGGIAGSVQDGTSTFDFATGVQVSGPRGSAGGLFGQMYNEVVSNSAATGSVKAQQASGGLVGGASGSTRIDASEADVAVTSGSADGGLVGVMASGTVSGSIAEGAVTVAATVSGSSAAGGLVGSSSGTVVEDSIAVGSVVRSGPANSSGDNGGLIGSINSGTVENSYAFGAVSANAGSPGAFQANGGLVGAASGSGTLVSNSFAMGHVAGSGDVRDGGLVGDLLPSGSLTLHDVYFGGTLAGRGSAIDGGIAGAAGSGLTVSGIDGFNSATVGAAVGTGAAVANSSGIGSGVSGTSGSVAALAGPGGLLHTLATSSGWTEVPGVNQGLPILSNDLVSVLTPASFDVAPSATDQMTVGLDYLDGVTGTQLSTEPVNTGPVDLPQINSGFSAGTLLAGSTKTVTWHAPSTIGTSVLMGPRFLAPVLITVSAAPPGGGPSGGGLPPVTPPPIITEPVDVGGATYNVISSLGYNNAGAMGGTFAGYVMERIAAQDGLSTKGEGGMSSYVVDILAGDGVDTSEVSATDQGQFAALYQKLGIIPDPSSSVSAAEGVQALVKAKASTLAIENYLVQLQGFTWAIASGQAVQGFPIQNA